MADDEAGGRPRLKPDSRGEVDWSPRSRAIDAQYWGGMQRPCRTFARRGPTRLCRSPGRPGVPPCSAAPVSACTVSIPRMTSGIRFLIACLDRLDSHGRAAAAAAGVPKLIGHVAGFEVANSTARTLHVSMCETLCRSASRSCSSSFKTCSAEPALVFHAMSCHSVFVLIARIRSCESLAHKRELPERGRSGRGSGGPNQDRASSSLTRRSARLTSRRTSATASMLAEIEVIPRSTK